MQDFRRSEVKVRNGIIFIAFFLVLYMGLLHCLFQRMIPLRQE